ncbi:hypothetical protein ACFQJ8_27105 [Halocatena marina]
MDTRRRPLVWSGASVVSVDIDAGGESIVRRGGGVGRRSRQHSWCVVEEWGGE